MILDVPELADGGKHVVFYGASWDFYEALLREYDEQPTRVNFDQGTLEIMILSIEHEAYKQAIGEMAGLISLELDVPVARRGSTTLKLKPKERGLESEPFPQIRIADLNPFLQRLATDDDTRVLRDFRDWLAALPR